jgi:hypothetical protein
MSTATATPPAARKRPEPQAEANPPVPAPQPPDAGAWVPTPWTISGALAGRTAGAVFTLEGKVILAFSQAQGGDRVSAMFRQQRDREALAADLLRQAGEQAAVRLDPRSLRRLRDELANAPLELQLARLKVSELQARAEQARLNPASPAGQADALARELAEAGQAAARAEKRLADLQAEEVRKQSSLQDEARAISTELTAAAAARLKEEQQALTDSIARAIGPQLSRLATVTGLLLLGGVDADANVTALAEELLASLSQPQQ